MAFTPAFVLGSATVILLAAGLAVAQKFAHRLTCKHFAGRVREMGFLLICFQRARCSNVSDAWLFPCQNRRLWVTFAGPYFELLTWRSSSIA